MELDRHVPICNRDSPQRECPDSNRDPGYKLSNASCFFCFSMNYTYTVYILYSEPHDRYYIGQTENIEQRLIRHNKKMVPSTKAYTPWNLVHLEHFASRQDAMKREKDIKSKKSRKYIEALIGT